MMLKYLPNGNLVPGIHEISWAEFVNEYGYTMERRDIIDGIALAIEHLSICGCDTIYIDGSFVTKERNPSDFDACWNNIDRSIDFQELYIKYRILSLGSKEEQQMKYKGDIRPAACPAEEWGRLYIHFFQADKHDNSPKGIIKLSI